MNYIASMEKYVGNRRGSTRFMTKIMSPPGKAETLYLALTFAWIRYFRYRDVKFSHKQSNLGASRSNRTQMQIA